MNEFRACKRRSFCPGLLINGRCPNCGWIENNGRSKVMTERLGDAPIEPRYFEKMNAVAVALDELFNGEARGANRETGFVLMVFPFDNPKNGDGRCNYISNGANRHDAVVLMKEMIARFEGQPEMKGTA